MVFNVSIVAISNQTAQEIRRAAGRFLRRLPWLRRLVHGDRPGVADCFQPGEHTTQNQPLRASAPRIKSNDTSPPYTTSAASMRRPA